MKPSDEPPIVRKLRSFPLDIIYARVDTLNMKITWQADPGPSFYYATVRDEHNLIVAHCPHRHRTREAAEKCAEFWLSRVYPAMIR